MQENDKTNAEIPVADTVKKGKEKDNRPAATVKVKSTKKQAFMYLGPNVPGGTLFSGGLFKCDSLKDIKHLDGLFEKLPAIKKLFVEVKDAPEFKRQLCEQGTHANSLYSQAQAQIAAAIKEGVFKNVI